MENKLSKMSNKEQKLVLTKCWIINDCAFQKGLYCPEVLMDHLPICWRTSSQLKSNTPPHDLAISARCLHPWASPLHHEMEPGLKRENPSQDRPPANCLLAATSGMKEGMTQVTKLVRALVLIIMGE